MGVLVEDPVHKVGAVGLGEGGQVFGIGGIPVRVI
jgi:hypothetical protein